MQNIQNKSKFFDLLRNKFQDNILFRYSTTFIVLILLMLLSLILTALISKKLIYDKTVKSLDYFEEYFHWNYLGRKSYRLLEGTGDVRNISIAYELNPNKPIDSIIRLPYQEQLRSKKNMKNTFINRKGKVVNYSRYWRGQAAYSKIMLVFMELKYTYVFQFIALVAVIGILSYKLFRISKALAISFIFMNISINSFFTAFSVEFFFAIFISYIMSIIVINLYKKDSEYIGLFFAIDGAVTCFFDVLTCETLALTLPLFIFIVLNIKDKREINAMSVIKYVLLWLLFYALTFATKWLLVCIHLGFDYFPLIKEAMSKRVVHKSQSFDIVYVRAILKSIRNLLPFYYLKEYRLFVFIGLLLISIIRAIFTTKKYLLLLLVALIPLGRYMILSSHSDMFYYYTYRAFGILVLFICFMLLQKPSINKLLCKDKKVNIDKIKPM